MPFSQPIYVQDTMSVSALRRQPCSRAAAVLRPAGRMQCIVAPSHTDVYAIIIYVLAGIQVHRSSWHAVLGPQQSLPQ